MKCRIALLCAVCALSFGGCYTVEAAGTDVARGGEKIQDASHALREGWREARDRNDREYEAARATCAGLSGTDRDACISRAQAQYNAHMQEARRSYPRSAMRSESDEDRMEDAYDAGRDRCDALSGADRDRCMADLRSRYRR